MQEAEVPLGVKNFFALSMAGNSSTRPRDEIVGSSGE